MATSRSVKNTRLGSHIRVILNSQEWIHKKQSEAPPRFPNISRDMPAQGLSSSPGAVMQGATATTGRRTLTTKTNPSPILRPTPLQARDVTPIPTPSTEQEDMVMPMPMLMANEEPTPPAPPINEAVTPAEV
ncbi:unnamed protein product [Calypogeia fissa]